MLFWNRNIGTLSAFCLGASLTYDIIPMICICIPIVFALVFSMIPNTPRYYFSKGDDNVSRKSTNTSQICVVQHASRLKCLNPFENSICREQSERLSITKVTNEVARKKMWLFIRSLRVWSQSAAFRKTIRNSESKIFVSLILFRSATKRRRLLIFFWQKFQWTEAHWRRSFVAVHWLHLRNWRRPQP